MPSISRRNIKTEQRSASDRQSGEKLLVQFIGRLHVAGNPQAIAEAVLQSIAARTTIGHASVILVGPDGSLEYAAALAGGEIVPLPRGAAARVLEQGLAGWVLRSGRAANVPDVGHDARWAAIGERSPSGSAIVLPLGDGQATFGVMTVRHGDSGHFAEADQRIFESVAACAGLAISATQGRAEAQSRRDEALSLLRISQFATSERSLRDLAGELLDKSGELLDALQAGLFLSSGGALALAESRIWPNPMAVAHDDELLAALVAAAEHAWSGRSPITEVAHVPAPGDDARSRGAGAPANLICVALPLLHNGVAVGVFALVCRAQGMAVFSARAWSTLTILTNVAAAAFANRQMIGQLHRRTELLEQEVRERTGQLQNSRDLLRIVFDHLPDGLVLLDADGRILAANGTFCREVIEQPLPAVIGRHYPTLAQELEQRAQLVFEPRPDDPAAHGARRVGPAGQLRWYEVDRYPVGAGSGQIIERWRDMTRQEELRHQLMLHEQLASLGRLAASVVHEVGNPLQSVRSCLELCRETCDLPEPAVEYLNLASGELTRMSHILAQLRDLYRPKREVWEQVNLNGLISVVQRITAPQLRRDGITLEVCLWPDLPYVQGQAGALHQVLLNLVLNAAAAMPEGGVIAISTESDTSRRLCIFSVADTGIGMSPRQLSQMFEPFTTGSAHGLGLGLYLSHQIIQQHGGTIDVTSTVNLGTTVTIYLPWTEEKDDN
jgi:signal transduction histidine kinase